MKDLSYFYLMYMYMDKKNLVLEWSVQINGKRKSRGVFESLTAMCSKKSFTQNDTI